MEDGIGRLVNSWALAWTIALMAGYLADFMPWEWIKALRARSVLKHMLLSTGAVLLGLTLAGVREQSAMLAAWAIVSASVKLLCDSVAQVE
jgi:hypothetical protein